jgi:hypothetical protein
VPPEDICRANADCGAGRLCDILLARCYQADGSCVSDDDCRPDHSCNQALRLCTGCGVVPLPFLICPEQQICIADICLPL